MENLVNRYNDTLIEIFKVISWLDEKRWKEEIRRPDIFVEEVLENKELLPTQKILIHWLIYITDRGKRADILWEKSTPKIKELVIKYFDKKISKKEYAIELFENWEKEEKNKIPAFPSDLESIKRTLLILLDYDKDIIHFITRKLSEWSMNYPENYCPRVAFSLYLLSYKDVGSLAREKKLREFSQDELNKKMDVAKEILNDDAKFEKEFRKWYSGNERWHKRIWAALRDYKKHRLIQGTFTEGIRENANRNVWKKDFTEQLELPGDIWNTRFFEKCIKPIAETIGVNENNAPKVVRILWEKIKFMCPETYPEQFDITFDFVPRMCNKKLCDVCIFGKNGVDLICTPMKDKYCPVTVLSCGYIAWCIDEQEDCILKKGISRGICSGGSR